MEVGCPVVAAMSGIRVATTAAAQRLGAEQIDVLRTTDVVVFTHLARAKPPALDQPVPGR